jgi:purine-binding chemotaxis protein CheW
MCRAANFDVMPRIAGCEHFREPFRSIDVRSAGLSMRQLANEVTGPRRGSSGDEAASARTSWLLCRAGSHLCAIPLAYVIEVMRQLSIETVAGAPPFVLGLSVVRGAVVPVIDAGLLLGEAATAARRLVAIRSGSRTVMLAVDLVLGVRTFADDVRNALPPLLRNAAGETIAAIGTLDAELLFFLRTSLSVPDELLDRLTAAGARAS